MERRCSDCELAQKVTIGSVRETGTIVVKNNIVISDSTTHQVSWSFILRRGCEQGAGTETVADFDKCISRREFVPKP